MSEQKPVLMNYLFNYKRQNAECCAAKIFVVLCNIVVVYCISNFTYRKIILIILIHFMYLFTWIYDFVWILLICCVCQSNCELRLPLLKHETVWKGKFRWWNWNIMLPQGVTWEMSCRQALSLLTRCVCIYLKN